MAKVNKTKKELTKQIHPRQKKKKKVVNKTKKTAKKQVKVVKTINVVPVVKKVEEIKKIEVVDDSKKIEHHPFIQLSIMLVIGTMIGVIPFFFYRPTNKNSTDEDTSCTYGDWSLIEGDYCMYNDKGEYFESDTVKYEFDEANNRCNHYIRIKTCK